MRIILTIFLLFLLLFKVSEPLVISLRYESAMNTPVEKSSAKDQLEIKMHFPMPYTGNWVDLHPIQQSFDVQGEIYNVVERRYLNDTLYLKLQRNDEASTQLGALNAVIASFHKNEPQHSQKSPAQRLTLDDLIKFFSMPEPPALVNGTVGYTTCSSSIWAYQECSSSAFLPVWLPPPECLSPIS